jgi:hypothetical protein
VLKPRYMSVFLAVSLWGPGACSATKRSVIANTSSSVMRSKRRVSLHARLTRYGDGSLVCINLAVTTFLQVMHGFVAPPPFEHQISQWALRSPMKPPNSAVSHMSLAALKSIMPSEKSQGTCACDGFDEDDDQKTLMIAIMRLDAPCGKSACNFDRTQPNRSHTEDFCSAHCGQSAKHQ